MGLIAMILAFSLSARAGNEFPPKTRRCPFVLIEELKIETREFSPPETVVKIPPYIGNDESMRVYEAMDWDSVLGKKVTVIWEPGRRERREGNTIRVTIEVHAAEPVEQMVLAPTHLDRYVQQGVQQLRENTYSETGAFRETGLFLVKTDRGTYRSRYFHSDSPELIDRDDAVPAFEALLKDIPKGAQVLEVHDMHTHPRRGYPLNSEDQYAFRHFELYDLERLGILDHRPIVRYYAVSEKKGPIFRQSRNFRK